MSEKALLECVPNFSEGRNPKTIDAISNAIAQTPLVELLHRDVGYDANRTVFTFAGRPDAVLSALDKAVGAAVKHIDLNQQKGAHPRIGAADVLPLVPLRNYPEKEAIAATAEMAEKIARDHQLPIYLYEKSAQKPERQNLANIRRGQWEGLATKMKNPQWLPDFGPDHIHPTAGASVMGVRDFLIAFNVSLNTQEVSKVKKIAAALRESGSKTASGVHKAGKFKFLKAIGWWMPSYDAAQVSMNFTNFRQTPIHLVFESLEKLAHLHGLQILGSELIGMLPEAALLESGRYFAQKENKELDKQGQLNLAVEKMKLDKVRPFVPEERILEWCMKESF